MKFKSLLISICICVAIGRTYAEDTTLDKNFGVFTSQQAQGYLKPLFTTIEESWNTGLYSSARYLGWSMALDFVAMGMNIPNSQRTYNAELPKGYQYQELVRTADMRNGTTKQGIFGYSEQPTIYGGHSTPVFAAPQNRQYPDTLYKSIAFLEGRDISQMPGIPAVQLIFGTPLLNQFRIRYWMVPIKSNPITYYMIGYNQNIDRIFGLFKESSRMGLALNFAYSSLKRDPEVSMSSWSAGMHFSKTWGTWFTMFFGGQMESMKGTFKMAREQANIGEIINSPYEEIRNGSDLKFDIESYTNYRAGGGLSMKLGALELKADAYYASQPVFSASMAFWLFQPDDIIPEEKPVPMPVIKKDTAIRNTFVAPPIVERIKELPPEELTSEIKIEENQEIIRQQPLAKPKLIADIPLYSEEENLSAELTGAITVEERAMRHLTPVLPYVFFDLNDFQIPYRYNLLDTEEVAKIKYKPIYGSNTLNNYYQVLNIIGGRLYENPKAKITLTGTNCDFDAELKNTELSRKRAEAVRDYFVNVWKIDPKRIALKARNLPQKFSNPKKGRRN